MGLQIYNTITKNKEVFQPLNPGHVGLYVCGPTVYGDAHLGHARPAVTFDVVYRYLTHLDYKVRYVRNITDVGHLVGDGDQGEDKIAKKARLEKLEPMEVVQHYTLGYHKNMQSLNTIAPSIEPRASGHIIEQIKMTQEILDAGFAYEVNGSVYFDVVKYNEQHAYGKLSGRKIEDLLSETRTLDGSSDKKNATDFALWKKAAPEHIMRWPSPWSDGFPGWHLECSAMSTKYLGKQFDIHGGGLDLLFPHHECEIAQSVAACNSEPAKYWMHNNMITINGQKMGKSLGNFITLDQLFSGEHKLLDQAYSPMTIRFFMLQAHYRSPLDFSNQALLAAEKGLERILGGLTTLDKIKASESSSVEIQEAIDGFFKAMNDDFNTPIALSHLFDLVKTINNLKASKATINQTDLDLLKNHLHVCIFDILGLKPSQTPTTQNSKEDEIMQILLELRKKAKENKDYETADLLRDRLLEIGIQIKDSREGTTWQKS